MGVGKAGADRDQLPAGCSFKMCPGAAGTGSKWQAQRDKIQDAEPVYEAFHTGSCRKCDP